MVGSPSTAVSRLNWRIHRTWSTDWFRNPDKELRKVVDAIETARRQPARPVTSVPEKIVRPAAVKGATLICADGAPPTGAPVR